jgi:hypothetical protein
MELDITKFFREAAPMDYSASRAEIGQSAGEDTWRAAREDAEEYDILPTDEAREAFRDHIKGFGAWEPEEIAAFTDTELSALCLQMVAGDMREADLSADADDDAWAEYQKRAERGSLSGRISRGTDGTVYYYLGD